MNSTVIAALISFAGTLIGTMGGIAASAKLTEYRLRQLEKKVDALGGYILKIPVFEERLSSLNGRLAEVKREEKINENFKGNHCENRNAPYCDC